MASQRCCKCLKTGVCVGCSCVKTNTACVNCYPSRHGRCKNLHSHSSGPISLSATCSSGLVSRSSCLSGPGATSQGSSSCQPRQTSPCSADNVSSLPTLEEIFHRSSLSASATFRHVPKGARDNWASLLQVVLSAVVNDHSSVDSWVKLFMLPGCILRSPRGNVPRRWGDMKRLVKERIKRWNSGDVVGLWAESVGDDDRPKPGRKRSDKADRADPFSSIRSNNARRARRAVGEGQYRKAMQCLTSHGVAPISSEVIQEMTDKHPQVPPPPPPPSPRSRSIRSCSHQSFEILSCWNSTWSLRIKGCPFARGTVMSVSQNF